MAGLEKCKCTRGLNGGYPSKTPAFAHPRGARYVLEIELGTSYPAPQQRRASPNGDRTRVEELRVVLRYVEIRHDDF